MELIMTWFRVNPYVFMVILMFIIFTVFVNLLDKDDAFGRYASAITLPWAVTYYWHVSTILMYGKSMIPGIY